MGLIEKLLEAVPVNHRWVVVVAIVAGLTYYQTHRIETDSADEMRSNLEYVVRQVVSQDNCKK
jgi:hypothetical protein